MAGDLAPTRAVAAGAQGGVVFRESDFWFETWNREVKLADEEARGWRDSP